MIKKQYPLILGILFLAALTVFVQSCMQDEFDFDKLDDEMEFQIGFVGPVAKGTLSFDDLIEEFDTSGVINETDEGLLYITYEDSLFSFQAADLIDIPDQDFFQYFYESDADIPPFINWGDSIVIARTELYEFGYTEDEKLDSLALNQGVFHIDIASNFLHDGWVEISIPGIQQNGRPFFERFRVSDRTGNFSTVQDFSLANHTIVIDNAISPDTSFVEVEFRLVFYNSGLGITSSDELSLEASMRNMEFGGIYGYIGKYELAAEQGSIDLDFFESSPLDGDIEFENPEINFIVSNSYGVPVETEIVQFQGVSSKDNSLVDLSFNSGVNPFRIAYPKLAEINQSKDTVISITGNNSTLETFLSAFPSQINYEVVGRANPDSTSVNGDYNFVLNESNIDIGFEFMLPLWFKAKNFNLEDTIDFDMEDISDQIENATAYLTVLNGLPLDISVQIFFLDENYAYVDYLLEDNDKKLFVAGELDSEFRVTNPTEKVSEISLSAEKLDRLKTVKYAHIVAGLETPNYDQDVKVKFYTDYQIEFKLSVDVDATITTE